MGDHCSCGRFLPRRTTAPLYYARTYLDFDLRVLPQLWLTAAFEANFLVNGPEDGYNFNFPKVGLRWRMLRLGKGK